MKKPDAPGSWTWSESETCWLKYDGDKTEENIVGYWLDGKSYKGKPPTTATEPETEEEID